MSNPCRSFCRPSSPWRSERASTLRASTLRTSTSTTHRKAPRSMACGSCTRLLLPVTQRPVARRRRPAAGRRPAARRRLAAGRRPAARRRPAAGRRPATRRRSAAGRRPATRRRSAAGRRPAARRRSAVRRRPVRRQPLRRPLMQRQLVLAAGAAGGSAEVRGGGGGTPVSSSRAELQQLVLAAGAAGLGKVVAAASQGATSGADCGSWCWRRGRRGLVKCGGGMSMSSSGADLGQWGRGTAVRSVLRWAWCPRGDSARPAAEQRSNVLHCGGSAARWGARWLRGHRLGRGCGGAAAAVGG